VVLGIGTVKYLQSTRGMVLLLDAGLERYYKELQSDLDESLGAVVSKLGMGGRVRVKRIPAREGRNRHLVARWEMVCPEDCDLVKVNLALTRAVRKAGAVVRASREKERGDVLFFEAGSRRFTTHRLIVRKRKPSAEPSGRLETEGGSKLAIVIDDFGYSRNGVADSFLHLDFPVTISVIPSLKYSGEMARRALENGKEVLLHLPMESGRKVRYDVRPVSTGMSAEEISALVEDYISELPGISGVNNHMGSKATADERVMRAVIGVLKKKGLFFLDSLTSPRSVAYNVAMEMGVGAARNDLFLDADTEDPGVVRERMERLIATAAKRGRAIGIGHPRRWTLEVMGELEGMLEGSGVRLVFLSELAKSP
jgi:polysaccharide deacetylase 2 family uncharacterized protein YibQ